MIRICPQCGKEFVADKRHHHYCSHECQRLHQYNVKRKKYLERKEQLTKTCPQCGKEFTTTDGRRVYCSGECYMANQRGEWSRMKLKTVRTCVVCGKEFSQGGRLYCSDACRSEARRRQANESYHRNNDHLRRPRSYNKCREAHDNCSWCEYPDCIF